MLAFFPSREIVLYLSGFEIRWYGVLYVASFLLALYLLPRLQRHRGLQLPLEDWLVVVTWVAVGIVVGGRLGYVVLYEPGYFAAHPLETLSLWQGGMASHGGFVGVGFVLWMLSRWYRWDLWKLLDVAVVPVALGLALGRLGNWINQELYVSNLAHMVAVVKNLAIAGVMYWHLRATSWGFSGAAQRQTLSSSPGVTERLGRVGSGRTLALFLILYGILRFITEYLRVQEWPAVVGLTRGQLFTLPIVAVGVWLWVRKRLLPCG